MAAESGLIRRFEVATQDEGETEEFIRQWYPGSRTRFLRAGPSPGFAATVAESMGIGAWHIRSTVDWVAELDPLGAYVFFCLYDGRQRIVHGREETLRLSGEVTFFPVNVPLRVKLSEMKVRSLRLPAERLARAAEETAGIRAQDLRFEALTPVSAAMSRQWAGVLALCNAMLLKPDSDLANPLMMEAMARTAAITALHTFPNTAMTVSYRPGPGWVAPVAVRRAVGFIHANAASPITVGQIADAAGADAQSVWDGFRRHLNVSPSEYLRRVRLEHASEELLAAEPDGPVTVTTVAHRWGWIDSVRFAAVYRRRFGVTPGQTLKG